MEIVGVIVGVKERREVFDVAVDVYSAPGSELVENRSSKQQIRHIPAFFDYTVESLNVHH